MIRMKSFSRPNLVLALLDLAPAPVLLAAVAFLETVEKRQGFFIGIRRARRAMSLKK